MKQIVSFILLLTGLLINSVTNAQQTVSDASVILSDLYRRLNISNNDKEKLRINDSVRLIIESYTGSDTVFTHRFYDLRQLGQITSPDRRIKIINWNLILEDSLSRYFCYIIHKISRAKENRVYRLETCYAGIPPRYDTIYSETDWYGALYYDVRPSKKGSQESWMVLGIDYGNSLITRKIIDVLSFTTDGKLTFGKKWFSDGREIKHREVFEYSAEAVMSLRFANDRLIVFDHLVPMSPELKGNREFYGPDYSYDAYSFEEGIWKLEINLDVRNRK